MVLKSPPAYFKTTNTSVQWQLGNYFEHCMGPPGPTSLCIVSSLPLIDILCPLHAESICTYQDLISPTQLELNPVALISPTAITPLIDPFDRSQRSLPHNGSPRHWLLNLAPLIILTDPSKSSIRCWVLECWRWKGDSRNVKPNRGSRVYVDWDEECGFRFLLSEKRREKEGTNTEEQQEYKMYSFSWIKKINISYRC